MLYGAGTSLYQVDVDSGMLSLIGPLGIPSSGPPVAIRGLAFVPEPALSLLLGTAALLGALAAGRFGRRAR